MTTRHSTVQRHPAHEVAATGVSEGSYHLIDGQWSVVAGSHHAGPPAFELSVDAQLLGRQGPTIRLASGHAYRPGVATASRPTTHVIDHLQIVAPVQLASLPDRLELRARAAAGSDLDTVEESIPDQQWQVSLYFANDAGNQIQWTARARAATFIAGWSPRLAECLGQTASDPARAVEPTPTPEPRVIEHPRDQFFELLVQGEQAGLLVYHVLGNHLTITHTMIESGYRGQGLSDVLVRAALDGIRLKSLTVSNHCPVVAHFPERHPEYQDLLTPYDHKPAATRATRPLQPTTTPNPLTRPRPHTTVV